MDPTRTLTLRNKAVSETNRRYRELKGLINTSIITNKVFNTGSLKLNAKPLSPNAFDGLSADLQLNAWNAWLFLVMNEVILGVPAKTPGNETPSFKKLQDQWLISYVLDGYASGADASNRALKPSSALVPDSANLLTGRNLEARKFLSSRVYTELKGVNQTMADQITQVLSKATLEGEGPVEIARLINDRVDKIGRTRARLIARTEIIYARNQAQIEQGQEIQDITDEEVYLLWVTAGDEKVRSEHRFLNGKIMTKKRASKEIGDPNCRCALSPVFKSQVPKGTKILR